VLARGSEFKHIAVAMANAVVNGGPALRVDEARHSRPVRST
jgi:hypothetical protein